VSELPGPNFDPRLIQSSGFNLYGTQFYSNNPCVSSLSQSFSVPEAVTQQLLSLSSEIAGTATDANPTVSVNIVTNQVFALSLPLKGGVEATAHSKSGLPLAAKIGIGVGAGIIFIVLGVVFLLFLSRKRKRGYHQRGTSNTSDTTAWAAAQRKSLASTSTAPTGATWDPLSGHFSYDSAASDPGYKPVDNQYVRMPPQRTTLQPMPMAQIGQFGHGAGAPVQPTYSELPGNSHEVFEVDASQPYKQGYSENTAYQGPSHASQRAYEMDGRQQHQQRDHEWI
jgi:hypothetical protein